ncbi:YbjN domain-containing protein [Tepidibacter sp. Z1-5]|uniref:YbjN domain-containing protein n=1 Tax=Tepidibacter sp. Z1-5 TaxID=3134138 RepID=UPI0030C5DB0F
MYFIENILDELKIKYEKKHNNHHINYLCNLTFDDEVNFPFRINIDNNDEVMGIYTYCIMGIKADIKVKLLEIINELNTDNVYGTFYIDEDNELYYYNGISLEGETFNLNINQMHDYISNMLSSVRELVEKCIEENVVNVGEMVGE